MVCSMNRWKGKVAVITGASSGIGAAIAEKLVEEGLQVVGLARRADRMDELSKKLKSKRGKFHPIKTDITKEEDILKAFDWVSRNLGPVHIIINNAGIVKRASMIEGDTEKWRMILDTNVLGLSIATREAVKIMRDKNIDGHIIHINSIAGHSVPFIPDTPGLNMYPPSKHAVTALTETVRQELIKAGTKIKITSISPGAVDTEIISTANPDMDPKLAEMIKNLPQLKSEDVADSVLYVLSTPPHVQVHELIIKPVGELF